MSSSQRNVLLTTSIIGVVLILGAWVVWEFFRTPQITTLDGRTVRDVPASESREMADDASAPIRRRYLTNLESYKKLETAPVTADAAANADRIEPAIREGQERDPLNRQAAASLPEGAIDSLADHVGLLLSRMAGLSEDSVCRRTARGHAPRAPAERRDAYVHEGYIWIADRCNDRCGHKPG